ncbi:hypothetical protein PPERSA_03288 [Pseudocohnilembus persalinus]|uniref:Uncharacterized protein n=1 Tax=Pseudocohnilembus persalinus TaxID=266149 RepID=A0A0V0Q8A1_PSEPJ|nr:hypothetical protein PPERSA_03288 [Pseudocohnilembus persalinus]|eukprot:KRW98457.1 hypothetical protein PPERSA_03288 [Pseudocohnilembus persalinus]
MLVKKNVSLQKMKYLGNNLYDISQNIRQKNNILYGYTIQNFKKQGFFQIWYIFRKPREIRIYQVPDLKLLKIIKAKAKIRQYIFHELFPLIAELHITSKVKAIRVYDPYYDKFSTYIKLTDKILSNNNQNKQVINDLQLLCFFSPFPGFAKIILRQNRDLLIFQIPYIRGQCERLQLEEEFDQYQNGIINAIHLKYLFRQQIMIIQANQKLYLYDAITLKNIRIIESLNINPYEKIQIHQIGINSIIIQNIKQQIFAQNDNTISESIVIRHITESHKTEYLGIIQNFKEINFIMESYLDNKIYIVGYLNQHRRRRRIRRIGLDYDHLLDIQSIVAFNTPLRYFTVF